MKFQPRTLESIAKKNMEFKLKSHVFPPDMILIQDTREQLPLFTRIPKGLTVCSRKLDDGDYSLIGHEKTFAIERKGISDLISYCTIERSKTQAKMKRFAKMEFVGLVVEVQRESELYQPYQYSKVSPELIRQCLISFSIRYNIHVYVGNRDNIIRVMLDWAIKYWNVKHTV